MSGRGLGPGRFEKIGDRWYAIWTDAHRHRHRKILSTDKIVAERNFRKIMRERDLDDAGMLNEEGQNRLVSEIVGIYLQGISYRRPRYLKALEYTLDAVMKELGPRARVRDATVPRLLLYRKKRLANGVANRTANADSNALRACFNWAVDCQLIAVNPLANIRRLPETEDVQVKRRRALSDDEIERLLTAAIEDDTERASRFAAERTISSGVRGSAYAARERMVPIPQAPLWMTLVATGLRYGEAATLRHADFDEAAGVITVRPEVAKSKRTRQVPVPGNVVEDLRSLRQIQAFALGRLPEPGDRVFLSPKHRPLDPHGNPARALLRRLLHRAGIPYRDDRGGVNVDIHALRRTTGTRLLRHNVPLAAVARVLGHTDVRVTMRHYEDLRIEDTKRAVHAVPQLARAIARRETSVS